MNQDRTDLRTVFVLLWLALGTLMLTAFFSMLGARGTPLHTYTGWLFGQLAGVALLMHLLSLSGRSLREFLPRWPGWRDLFFSVVVAAIAWAAFWVLWRLLRAAHPHWMPDYQVPPSSRNPIMRSPLVLAWIMVFVNPFFEEVIVRIFLQQEVTRLTGRAWQGMALGVLIQTFYHLYQGVEMALALGAIFLVFAIGLRLTRSPWAIILAHFYFDFVSLLRAKYHF